MTTNPEPRTTLNIQDIHPNTTTWEVAEFHNFATLHLTVGRTQVTMFADSVTDIAKVLTLASIALLNPRDGREVEA